MTVYYIGPTGSSSNSGTRSSPFASMADVAGRLQPGDTVYYLSGTYRNSTWGATNAQGQRDIWKDNDQAIIRLNNVHGTEAAPITISPEPGATVKFEYDGPSAITLRASSHIIVQGFDIGGPNQSLTPQQAQDAQWTYRIATSLDANGQPVYTYYERDPTEVMTQTISSIINFYSSLGIDQSGSGKPDLFNGTAISVQSGSHHISILNNVIHDSASQGIRAESSSDYLIFSGNTLYNNTWYTSNGTHAITVKNLNSIDDSDAYKIIVTNNHLYDNYNLLISWVMTKLAVERKIDEGKAILVQDSIATPQPNLGSIWDHGRILIANNIIERSGNAGISLNDARGVEYYDNVFIDNGYINTLIRQDSDPSSPWFNFFTQQQLDTGYLVTAGGIRSSASTEAVFDGNVIVISDSTLFAVDTATATSAPSASAAGNVFSGGAGLRIRSEPGGTGPLTSGFTEASGLFRATLTQVNVTGGTGHDILLGSSGSNLLRGGAGNDQLVGLGDADVFVIDFAGGDDRILDFEAGVDKIRLETGQYRFDQLAILQVGRDTIIKTPDGVITLPGVTASSITENDFIFVIFGEEADAATDQSNSADISTNAAGTTDLAGVWWDGLIASADYF